MSITVKQSSDRILHRWQTTERGEGTWIQLPSTALQTRYRLHAMEHTFSDVDTAAAIQLALQQWERQNETAFPQYYLIAQPHADAPCYHITDYVKQCVAGELAIGERLRGRTVLRLHQTEEDAADLLSHSGVSAFIEQILVRYLNSYKKKELIGFTCELPRFLSIWANDPATVPWSPTLSADETSPIIEKQSSTFFSAYLPLVFYETYDTSAVRSAFWQTVTKRFASCFLGGLRDFCHQQGLRFALSLPAAAKALEFELGTMLAHVDCPILETTELETPRRFVVAKWICSTARQAGMLRKGSHKVEQTFQDAALGFNLWFSTDRRQNDTKDREQKLLTHLLTMGYPKRPLLMISPTQSMWTKPDEKLWNTLTKACGWLCDTVTYLGYDVRIVSELELSEAKVRRHPPRLCFGTAPEDIYRVVLLPSCISLQEETVACLRAFTKAKGKIIANEPTPYLLNGRIGLEPYPLEQLIYSRRTSILRGPSNERAAALKKYLRKWVTPVISVYAKPANELTHALRVHHRVAEESHLFYLFNTHTESIDTLLEISELAENLEEVDLQTGATKAVNFWDADRKTYLNCGFMPKQAKFFRLLCKTAE